MEPVISKVKDIVPDVEITYTKYTTGKDETIPEEYTKYLSTVPTLYLRPENQPWTTLVGAQSELKLMNVILSLVE